ncbi:hypothetical protein HET73_02995, partial [Wolbachia endosymbiont of Atemnus politus]|nr:hypothetical protein [Wolbachia endosymbiont of Atemnus politus]
MTASASFSCHPSALFLSSQYWDLGKYRSRAGMTRLWPVPPIVSSQHPFFVIPVAFFLSSQCPD